MLETENVNSEFSEIEQMKTFHPTESEFENPIDYIENIMEKYDGGKYGCVKIVPPPSFKPDVALDLESNVKYPTRYQIL